VCRRRGRPIRSSRGDVRTQALRAVDATTRSSSCRGWRTCDRACDGWRSSRRWCCLPSRTTRRVGGRASGESAAPPRRTKRARGKVGSSMASWEPHGRRRALNHEPPQFDDVGVSSQSSSSRRFVARRWRREAWPARGPLPAGRLDARSARFALKVSFDGTSSSRDQCHQVSIKPSGRSAKNRRRRRRRGHRGALVSVAEHGSLFEGLCGDG